jgi:hypothetical protein
MTVYRVVPVLTSTGENFSIVASDDGAAVRRLPVRFERRDEAEFSALKWLEERDGQQMTQQTLVVAPA